MIKWASTDVAPYSDPYPPYAPLSASVILECTKSTRRQNNVPENHVLCNATPANQKEHVALKCSMRGALHGITFAANFGRGRL